jgi:hypothetical protein
MCASSGIGIVEFFRVDRYKCIEGRFARSTHASEDLGLQLLDKYVLSPLGLTPNTGYNLTEYAVAHLIPAYDSSGARVPLEHLGWAAPCGTMWSSMPNLARFHQTTAALVVGDVAAAPPGFFLSPARARSWLQPESLTPDNSIVVGAPWETFVLPSVDGGFVVRTKSGTLNGYSIKSGLVAELRLSFAFAFNGNFVDWYAGNALVQALVGELVPAFTEVLHGALQPSRPAGPSPADYVGTYKQAANPENVATIELDGAGQLALSAPGTLGVPAVLEWAGAAAPEVFRMYQDAASNSCEHAAMADTAFAIPVVFTRSAGPILSMRLVNWDGPGPWTKR